MQNQKLKMLHQTAVEAVDKVKEIHENHIDAEEEKPTFGEKFTDLAFRVVSSWLSIFLFASFISTWIIFNIMAPAKYAFDRFPFLLMTFLLAGIAAIQAPVIMMSQERQNQKNNKRIAVNLKVENEILALHQSITVIIEQQLQQVHANQLITHKLLEELYLKQDPKIL